MNQDGEINVFNQNINVIFNKKTGFITTYRINGIDFLKEKGQSQIIGGHQQIMTLVITFPNVIRFGEMLLIH